MKSREIICTTILSVLVYFAFSPQTRAACGSPDLGCPGANLAEGYLALASLTTGTYNTGIGTFSLLSLTDGNFNTGIGAGTLLLNTAAENTATGAAALLSNTAGTENTANGAFALFSNTTGGDNTANGVNALFNNTEGAGNTAIGKEALAGNTFGFANTAIGVKALFNNTEAFGNTAIGEEALFMNNLGSSNTAIGSLALHNNVGVTSANTAVGSSALHDNHDGEFNTAVGNAALSQSNGEFNTAMGDEALVSLHSGSSNTAIGGLALSALTQGGSNIALGRGAGLGVTSATGVIVIGTDFPGANVDFTCFIANIRDVQTQNTDAIPVLVDSAGQLGTVSSSQRFKKEIKPMDKASEAILALKPVTFHYKSDKKNAPQYGLLAEEVAKVNPDLVVRDKNGEIYTVRYDQVNAMLLNEFLKEHRKVEEQETTITQLKKDFQATVAQLTARLDEQAGQIQKVSAQLEVSKPAPQTVLNSQ
jgi:trimeric autotransporter adhesin